MTHADRPWLADALLSSLTSMLGSQERMQIATLLSGARRIRLSDDLTGAISSTLRFAPDSLERNLDSLRPQDGSVWLEYDHGPRIQAFDEEIPAAAPTTVGALLARSPADPSKVSIFVTWRLPAPPEGGKAPIRHSYAILEWDMALLVRVAASAPSSPDGNAMTRIMQAARVEVPIGFEIELDVIRGEAAANDPVRNEALARTKRDAAGEHLFLLAAAMILSTPSVSIVPARDGERAEASLSPNNRRRAPWSPSGFSQSPFGGLRWTPPSRRLVERVRAREAAALRSAGELPD